MINKWKVIGLDSFTNYYDIRLKKDRNSILEKNENFYGNYGDLKDIKLLHKLFNKHKPNVIVHLAAQAGVRYSIDNPLSYVESNLLGTFNLLELAKNHNPEHLLLASTSSVCSNKKLPFDEKQNCDSPISFYASTKKSNEAMAHSYSHLFNIPTTIL